jgi:hypothetical protein
MNLLEILNEIHVASVKNNITQISTGSRASRTQCNLKRMQQAEFFISNIEVYIPPMVMSETTQHKDKFIDALIIHENIEKGLFKVKNPSHSSFVKSLGIKGGEAQVLMLHEKSFAISRKFLEKIFREFKRIYFR